MAFSVFAEKGYIPAENDIADVLGGSRWRWDSMREHLATEYAPVSEVWVFSGKKWGYSLRLKQKKRAIVYLTPKEGYFVAGFSLGKKAVEAARTSSLPQKINELIDNAPTYAEGRGLLMEVQTDDDLESALTIARLKMAH